MSLRPRRALLGLIAGVVALAALPASALAAGETLTVAPASTQAGGATSVTTTLSFAAGDTPKTVVISLAPGMLGNLNANPGCLIGAPQLTPSCQIGTVTVATNGGPVPGNMYLVAGQGSDAAGIDVVTPLSAIPQYIGVTLNPSAPGGLNLTTTFAQPPAPAQITGFTANFTTLNGQPFTRLPSSCSPATSTFSTTYYGATPAGSASGSFTPTGCSSLPYAPSLKASVTKDKADTGAALSLTVSQAANESASKSIVFGLPKGFTPNINADLPCLTATGCKVGTATATSPLVPSVALANGTVTLAVSGSTPTITIAFPAPFAITETGTVNLTQNSVTFAAVPDVPLTSLALNITGPNGKKAFTTTCAKASISGAFTAQSGATHTASAPIIYTGCAAPPTVTGSTSGLGAGKPKVKLKVAHGKGAPNVQTVSIGLPGGLKFSRSAIKSHKTCTTLKNKKKKCTTTTTISGLGVSGAKAKKVALNGGKLVVTLSKAAGKVSFTVSGPLLSESKGLQTKVKKHKAGKLTFTLKVTDAKHTVTTVRTKLAAH